MLHKTEGVALSYIKYRDTSIIARIYTQRFGLQSYVVNGIRSSRSRMRMAMFQPLSLLDLVVYYNKKKEINRISEIGFTSHLLSLHTNVRKAAIAIFMAEFMGKVLKEDHDNIPLFEFIKNGVNTLDGLKDHFENFHLVFLLKFTDHMGIKPISAENLLHDINSLWISDVAKREALDLLMNSEFHESVKMSHKQRNELLDAVLFYYQHHLGLTGNWKSLQVLREVF
jgi:DNA repair protein RecO (recombination protein O)